MQILNAFLAQDLEELEDGTLNVFGILGGLRVTAVPYQEPLINLFVHFSANPGEVRTEKLIDVELWEADGDLMKRFQTTVTVPDARRTGIRSDFNVNLPLENVPFIHAGDYGFNILVEGIERTIPFYISVEEGET